MSRVENRDTTQEANQDVENPDTTSFPKNPIILGPERVTAESNDLIHNVAESFVTTLLATLGTYTVLVPDLMDKIRAESGNCP